MLTRDRKREGLRICRVAHPSKYGAQVSDLRGGRCRSLLRDLGSDLQVVRGVAQRPSLQARGGAWWVFTGSQRRRYRRAAPRSTQAISLRLSASSMRRTVMAIGTITLTTTSSPTLRGWSYGLRRCEAGPWCGSLNLSQFRGTHRRRRTCDLRRPGPRRQVLAHCDRRPRAPSESASHRSSNGSSVGGQRASTRSSNGWKQSGSNTTRGSLDMRIAPSRTAPATCEVFERAYSWFV